MPWEVSPDNEVEKIPHQSSSNLSQTINTKMCYKIIAKVESDGVLIHELSLRDNPRIWPPKLYLCNNPM